jgi:predicted RNA-binding Zn ribbon-like protein
VCYRTIVTWGLWSGALAEQQAQLLLEEAASRPDEAAIIFAKAIIVREAIYRIFLAVAHGHQPLMTDLDLINAPLSESLSRRRIVPKIDGFALEVIGCERMLESVIWQVVQSSADLLSSTELNKVRVCENKGCGWLFIDRSRSFKRRWLSGAENFS